MKETLKSSTEQAKEIDIKKRALEAKAQIRFRKIFDNIANDVSNLLLVGNVNPKEIAQNYKPDVIGALRETYREVIKTFGFSLREQRKSFNIKLEKKRFDTKQEFEITENEEQQINKDFFVIVTLFINNRSETQANLITQTNENEINSHVLKANVEHTLLLANNLSEQQKVKDKLNKIALAIVLGTSTEKQKQKLTNELNKLRSQEESLKVNKKPIIARAFKKNFSQRGKTRSEIISEFEVGQTESFTRQTEGEVLNERVITKVTLNIVKNWDATLDNKTREAHVIADKQYHFNPIPVNDFFFVGGEKLKYPRDPNGSASNVINCRCISIYSIKQSI